MNGRSKSSALAQGAFRPVRQARAGRGLACGVFKLELLQRDLVLAPGMTVVDLGAGWLVADGAGRLRTPALTAAG
jgi:hypothetical protein